MFSKRTKGVTTIALLPPSLALPIFRFSHSNMKMDVHISQLTASVV